jgi:dienelactone hydrolase
MMNRHAARARAAALDREGDRSRLEKAVDALLADPDCMGSRVGIVGLGASAEWALSVMGGNPRVGAVAANARLPEPWDEGPLTVGPKVLLLVGEETPRVPRAPWNSGSTSSRRAASASCSRQESGPTS